MAAGDIVHVQARPSLGVRRRRIGEDIIKAILGLAALVSVLTTVGIVIALILPALDFFRAVSPVDFFTGTDWAPLFQPAHFGVLPLLAGTLVVTFIALLVCVPCGLGAAIYLSEYAHPRVRNVLKPILEVLVGIPTVVFGYFALTLITPTVLRGYLGLSTDVFNALAAGLVMGVMLLPIVASLSEDAMTAFIGATANGDVPTGSIEYKTIFAVGLTLFVLTLAMNLIAIRLVRKYREVYE